MRRAFSGLGLMLAMVLAALLSSPHAAAAEPAVAPVVSAVAAWSYRDRLGRDWLHEPVFLDVEAKDFGRKDLSLFGPGDKPVAFQWVEAKDSPHGKPAVVFIADVKARGSAAFRLLPGAAAQETDLTVTESPDAIEIGNSKMGLRIARGAGAMGNGPIGGVRLA
ncbi:MAG: hypothetical protein NTW19_17005 [Planctomycetota bacterium]|nr:hypothetical protein [Planctomycetota bacterium]